MLALVFAVMASTSIVFVSGAQTLAEEAAADLLQETSSLVSLTDEERAYVADHPTVSIALDVSWVPYAYEDPSSGELKGVLVNLFDAVCGSVGLQPEYVAKDSYQDALAAAKAGETQLVSGIADDAAMAAKNGLSRTSPYVQISYCVVTKGSKADLFSVDAHYRMAVCAGSYSTMAMKERMPGYEFVEYHSNDECMAAVESGEVDAALVASYAADYYRAGTVYGNLDSALVYDFDWGLCFGVGQRIDPVLVGILNKGIGALTANDSTQAVYLGMMSALSDNWTIGAWIARNQLVCFSVIALLGAVMLLAIALRLRRRMRSLRAQRDRDGLTGLLNRPALEREVSRFLASREPKEAVFFMFDLDDFKGVNDRYGHDAGDEVLKAVASSIQEVFRSGDIVARLGGDEFVVFSSMADEPRSSARRARLIQETVSSVFVPAIGRRCLSASVGAASFPSDGSSFAQLYRHADSALYDSKRNRGASRASCGNMAGARSEEQGEPGRLA